MIEMSVKLNITISNHQSKITFTESIVKLSTIAKYDYLYVLVHGTRR